MGRESISKSTRQVRKRAYACAWQARGRGEYRRHICVNAAPPVVYDRRQVDVVWGIALNALRGVLSSLDG